MSPEDSKPEWFQMTQADAFEPKSTNKRVVRIIALTTPLLVLGAGLVFAQTQDSPSAVASSGTNAASTAATTHPISLSSTPTAASTPVASTPTAASTPVSNTVRVSQSATATTTPKASITIKKPGIKLPASGENDGLRSSDDD